MNHLFLKKENTIYWLRGFSLVEMSIVLIIIGLISASALSIGSASLDGAKAKQTTTKMQGITDALASFFALNQRLPCPADPSLAVSNLSYGTEVSNCASGNTSGVVKGILPYKTLQLPPIGAQDGYGNLYSYAVDPNFTSNTQPSSSMVTTTTPTQSTTNVTLSMPSGNNFVTTPSSSARLSVLNDAGGNRTGNGVYVVISHGKNGLGAWTNAGSNAKNGPSTNSYEQMNYGSGAVFAQQSTMDTNVAASNFDDVVSYREKGQILKEASVILASSNCIIASNILNFPQSQAYGGPSEFCYGTTDPVSCSSFLGILAEKVSSLCP